MSALKSFVLFLFKSTTKKNAFFQITKDVKLWLNDKLEAKVKKVIRKPQSDDLENKIPNTRTILLVIPRKVPG